MTNLLFTNNIIIKRSTRMMIFIAQKYSPTTSTISSSGNKYKDVTVTLYTSSNLPSSSLTYQMDVKSGNNADNPFSGILAEIPYTSDLKPYAVINKTIDLDEIQKKRMNYFLADIKLSTSSKELRFFFKQINNLPLDQIQKNIMIQEKMFILMSENMISQKPSFYQAFIMDQQPHLKQLFYEKLSPYITPNIFDNAKNAQIFIKKALKIYNENVTEISQNIAKSKSTWKDSGFDLITDDIFKD